MRPRLRCWAGCAIRSVLHGTDEKPALRRFVPGTVKALYSAWHQRCQALDGARAFDEPQAVLELRGAELELVHLVARDEAELPGDTGEALPRPLADASRVAAPARDRVFEQLPCLVPAHPAPLGEVAGELVDPLGSQRDRTDRGERH